MIMCDCVNANQLITSYQTHTQSHTCTHTHTQTTEKQRDQIDKSTVKEYLVKTWMTTSISSKTQKKEWNGQTDKVKQRIDVQLLKQKVEREYAIL